MTWFLISWKKIIELQNSIELNELDYKNYDFNKVLLINLLIENFNKEQSNLFKLLGTLHKSRKSSEKVSFLKM